jgi:addiction module HigA family antidote
MILPVLCRAACGHFFLRRLARIDPRHIGIVPAKHRHQLMLARALSDLLNEKAALSPEMALRIELAFGASMEMLLRIQTAWDIATTWQREPALHAKRWGLSDRASSTHWESTYPYQPSRRLSCKNALIFETAITLEFVPHFVVQYRLCVH